MYASTSSKRGALVRAGAGAAAGALEVVPVCCCPDVCISVLRFSRPPISAADLLRSQKAPVRNEARRGYTSGRVSPSTSRAQAAEYWLPDQGSNLGPAD